MKEIDVLKSKVFSGILLDRNDALFLNETPLEALCAAADEIRAHYCGNRFDMCTIINGKCGQCSEDCKYCAQSAHYPAACTDHYPLLPTKQLVEQAKQDAKRGVLRYSIVTSGKKLSDQEVAQACRSIRAIREEVGIHVCVSFGLLSEAQFVRLKAAGVSRVHCNLETSERYFPQVCTTHTWRQKVETLRNAQRAGLEVCSGGIIGLGETMEDRIDMVLAIRGLGVKSIPVNLLNPIPGTLYENNPVLPEEALRRVIAVFRFLIPDGFIRLAGGRGLLKDNGAACFRSGANAAISGDMLTTSGYSIETDQILLKQLGYEVRCPDE